MNYGIHWFRRDLRVAGNPSLKENWQKNNGKVVGLFCFDSKFLSRQDFSHHRFAFFLKTLSALKVELESIGSELLVVDQSPQDFFRDLKQILRNKPQCISFNKDYEPFARTRDSEILKILSEQNVHVITARDHLLIEPQELVKDDGTPYQVYTPFAKKWFELFQKTHIQNRIQSQVSGLDYLKDKKERKKIFSLHWADICNVKITDQLQNFTTQNQKYVSISIPDAGSFVAYNILKNFEISADAYAVDRDYPALAATSRLAMYLKNGSLVSAQIIKYLNLGNEHFASESGKNRFLKELVWREFYYSILWHNPRVESEAFIEKYKLIKWHNNKEWFERWCLGQTGFPIVDAGMRELNTTGWMHNRVRMIVASFLVKDLLVDWRWGENYFMKMLLDGDLAANNGGWQWAASTGCDPQPYFRIFNPLLQSQKFDPSGEYIRKYIPELAHIKDKSIHQPQGVSGYPKPIVDHQMQKISAIQLFKTT